MNQFWNNNRETIIDLIKINKEYSKKYNDSCEVLINLYSKYKKRKIKVKTISFEDKLLEFLKAMKDNGNKIISSTSSLLFSDGTKMRTYWNGNKDKIYKMITEEGNPFVEQYKKQCEVLINEYVKFQEKKKKEQEKYKESESDFREESSFDKILKNEKGKYSNEGKKVL